MAPKARSLGLAEGELALAAHSADWADAFASEAARIRAAMRAITLTFDHIGSTSVPGLPAKPILDLALCVSPRDEPAAASALEELDYTDRGYRSGRLFVRCDNQGARTHNLHLYLDGDSEHRDQICFRNALRADPALRDAYAALKRELVGKLGAAGRAHYADAKADFIQAAIKAERSAPD